MRVLHPSGIRIAGTLALLAGAGCVHAPPVATASATSSTEAPRSPALVELSQGGRQVACLVTATRVRIAPQWASERLGERAVLLHPAGSSASGVLVSGGVGALHAEDVINDLALLHQRLEPRIDGTIEGTLRATERTLALDYRATTLDGGPRDFTARLRIRQTQYGSCRVLSVTPADQPNADALDVLDADWLDPPPDRPESASAQLAESLGKLLGLGARLLLHP